MSLRIIVCVKQVFNSDELKVHNDGKLITENVHKIINSDDLNALEEALKIKDSYSDTHITAVTMGDFEAKNILLECLALGADDAVLISDNSLEDSDTLVTAEVLSAAIKKLGEYDLILTGRQAIGGDTAQVGPQIAELLNIPQITGIVDLKIENDMKSIMAKKVTEDNYMLLKTRMPCLMKAMKELNKPRNMSLRGIHEAKKKELKIWNINDIGFTSDFIGLNASTTKVVRTFVPVHNKNCRFIHEETEQEAAQSLIKELHAKYIV